MCLTLEFLSTSDNHKLRIYIFIHKCKLLNHMSRCSWAISGTFDFGEWLSNTNQTILIEEYVRLLNSWCEYNSCSRKYNFKCELTRALNPNLFRFCRTIHFGRVLLKKCRILQGLGPIFGMCQRYQRRNLPETTDCTVQTVGH
jgi:hypothetical protein